MTKRKYSSHYMLVCVYRYMLWYRKLLDRKPQLIRRMSSQLEGFPPYCHHDTGWLLPRVLSFLSGSLKCRSLIQLIHVILTMERITNAINTFVITIYFFFNAFFFMQLYFLKALFMQLYASMGSRVDRKPLSSKDATLFFYCFFFFQKSFHDLWSKFNSKA